MAAPSADMPPELLAALQYQKEHITDDHRALLIGIAWALWILAVIALVLRFYAERMVRTPFKYHDALIVLGLVGAPVAWDGPPS